MAALPRLVCGSANPHKVAEIATVLRGIVDLEPRPATLGDVVEDAPDLEGNARLKAVAVCAAAGAGLDDILKLNVYLLDMTDFAVVNTIMAGYFSEPYPARAAIGVAALPRGARVEMDAIAGL